MGKVLSAQKPTSDETAVNLLRLGQLLHKFSHPKGVFGFSRPIRPDEAERLRTEIGALEKRIEEAVADSRQWLLRGVFGLRGRESVDAIAIRIVACVAWSAMVSDRPEAGIASVANSVAMGEWGSHLEARKTIRQLVARGAAIQIVRSDCYGDVLTPNSRLIRFLSGDGNLPVLFSSKSIQEEKDDWQRQRQAEVLKKVRTPRRATTEVSPEAHTSDTSPSIPQTPKAIFGELRNTVIGMDPVVRRFSIQMAMHLKRVAISRAGGTPTNPPVVALLIGPSGSGKTFLAEEAGRLLKLPYCCSSMAAITASSYVGLSIEDAFLGFYRKGVRPEEIGFGLMLMDEIDKRRTNQRGGDFDSVGTGVQYELLRILEEDCVQIGGKRGTDAVRGHIHTFGMAFVLAGAFSDIADKLRESEKTRTPLGFSGGHGTSDVPPDTRELLLEYFIPELVNRIGSVIVIPLPSLTQLEQIMTAPMGILARQNQFLSSFGLQVLPSPEAVRELASWALESKMLARGMRSLIQSLVEEAIFDEHKGALEISDRDVRRVIEVQRMETNGLII